VSRIPTPEQRRAIETRAGDVLLEAGAGTGKTGVLVDRYCDLIEREGHHPDQLLAFTFTERAAAQLRERVRAELGRRAGRAADPAEARRLQGVVASFGGAWITTIHGFCRRLLAAHPVAAGIDPSFRVLDEPEAQRAARAAFDAALEEFLAEGDPDRQMMVAAYRVEGLRDLVIAGHAELRARGETSPRLPPPPEPDVEAALASLERCATAALEEPKLSRQQRERIQAALALAAARDQRTPALDELLPLLFKAGNGARGECLRALRRATSRIAERDGGRDVYLRADKLLEVFGRRFEQAKTERSALDFEDLQLRAVDLLQRSRGVRERYSERLAEILVDEFQDTNSLQLALVEALRGRSTRVFCVGDELQSIYGFRNADVEVFRAQRARLREEPGAEVLPLSGNFRSRSDVVAAANRLGDVLLGEAFNPLTMGSAEQGGPAPGGGAAVELLLTECDGWEDLDLDLPVDDKTQPKHVAEARFLAARLRALADEGVPRCDMVVLLRAFTRVDAYEEALDRAGLDPYVVGGRGYWSQQQVGDLLALLRTVANPLDDEALLGALASPACGLSPDSLWVLRRAAGARRHLWPTFEQLAGSRDAGAEEPEWLDSVSEDDRAAAAELHAVLAGLREAGTRLGLEELIQRAVRETGYDLAALMRRPGRMRMANVRKLMRMAREFEASEGRDLRAFLEFAELRGEADDEAVAATEAEDHDGVRVMTIHNAKGLEFPVVAVPDLDRDLLIGGFAPALRVGGAPGEPPRVGLRLTRLGAPSVPLYDLDGLAEDGRKRDSEEALRLFYVAITRAQDRLLLSGVTPKGRNGEIRPNTPVVHRLLAGLGVPPEGEDEEELVLDPPAAREGLDAAYEPGRMLIRRNTPSAETAAALVRQASGPAPEEALGEGPPPIARAGAPATPLRPLSYSALQEHRRCGFRFHAERVLGLGDGDAATGASEERGERFGMGSAVHSLLEWSARRGWLSPPEDLVGRTLVAEGVDPAAERVASARAMVEGWSASDLCAGLTAAGRLRPELPFLVEIGGALVRGSIDLMGGGEDAPLVVDYKTDRLGGAEPEELADGYALQRALYALAAAEATGSRSVRVAYVFLERPEAPVIDELGPAELAQAQSELEEEVAAIAAGRFAVTPTPDWPLCHDCPARRRLCPSPAPPPGAAHRNG
jgi:ATP-dependent exoDNAse (exonuclease V) beta subunit